MSNVQVLELLERMLSSAKTPEEVCRDCPELLAEVRQRWQEFRRIDARVGDLIPGLRTASASDATTPVPCALGNLQVPGYELLGKVGHGGMGIVFQARDLSLHRDVAVKLLQDGYSAGSTLARRFADEARITAQLQHPGIPPVHQLGELPDGRPFLAMKLIKGNTLDRLLAARKDPTEDRGRFVAVFEKICETVGYAHAHNVIHRDLKPSNVMVGAFGEVQVMDWGLAKVLTARGLSSGPPDTLETPAASAIRPVRDANQETQAGSLLGTPAYMPPEQAIGAVDRIDARSDVFSLGGILCAVLTGRPPYVGDTSEATRQLAARARLEDAHSRLASCWAEHELVDLCVKCLASEQDDRPRNAGDVAIAVAALRAAAEERARQAELQRVQAEGEAREAVTRTTAQRQRRRLLLYAGGLIVLVLLAGLSVSLWQTQRAMHFLGAERQARQDESKAREQAFAALRTMSAELIERKFSQGIELTDDDRKFLRGVIAQFDAFAAIKGDDAESRAVRAEGRLRVGWIRNRLGDVREAEQDYDQALSIFKQLAADFPSRSEFRRQLASSHNHRGALLHATGRIPDAEMDYNQALSIQKQLVAEFPSQSEFRRELAGSYLNRGLVFDETSRLREAEADYNQAMNIQKQLTVDFPDRPEFRYDLTSSFNNRGVLLSSSGRTKEAETDYEQALRILKQLVADFPSRPDFGQDLAGTYVNRGVLLRGMDRLQEAERDYDQALSNYKQLIADFPSRPELRRQLATGHLNRGVLLHGTGRIKEAEADYDEALSINKQLAAEFPDQPDLQSELANTYGNLAHHHLRQGNVAAAMPLLVAGGPHHLAALKANPRHLEYQLRYRNHLGMLTAARAGQLEPEEAVRTAETCRDLGWNAPGDAYDAACFLTQCVRIVNKHDKLEASQRDEAAQFYSDAAMRLLREAVSKGYADVSHLQQDTDLDPLRQRDDFQQLIGEIRKKGP